MSSYRTPYEAALLLAVLLGRSGQTRARVSAKTLKLLAKRANLRTAFVIEMMAALANDFGWLMTDLASGGYGVIQAKTLEAAKPVTVKKLMTEDERKALRRGQIDLAAFEQEVSPDTEGLDDDD